MSAPGSLAAPGAPPDAFVFGFAHPLLKCCSRNQLLTSIIRVTHAQRCIGEDGFLCKVELALKGGAISLEDGMIQFPYQIKAHEATMAIVQESEEAPRHTHCDQVLICQYVQFSSFSEQFRRSSQIAEWGRGWEQTDRETGRQTSQTT